MTPNTLRLAGIVLLIAAAITAILNLHRVADLGVPWLAPLLLVMGVAFITFSRRRRG